jgi:siroheme synthase
MLPPALVPPAFNVGAFWLVSAGPGEPELLAPQAAQKAAINFGETVVPGEIFSLASPCAAGGTGGSPTRDATRPEQTVQITSPGKAIDQPVPVVTLRQRLTAWQQPVPSSVVANQQQTRIAG